MHWFEIDEGRLHATRRAADQATARIEGDDRAWIAALGPARDYSEPVDSPGAAARPARARLAAAPRQARARRGTPTASRIVRRAGDGASPDGALPTAHAGSYESTPLDGERRPLPSSDRRRSRKPRTGPAAADSRRRTASVRRRC